MDREKEIAIIIQFLKNEIFQFQKDYPELVIDKIVENGKLIEGYQRELSKIGLPNQS